MKHSRDIDRANAKRPDELGPVGMSFTDLTGLLVRSEGDLLRHLPAASAPFFRDLFERGVMKDLIDRGLFVDSTIAPTSVDDGGLTVWHRLIPLVVYPDEWCPPMLKDAARLQLDLCEQLEDHGLTCGDAHPLNIVFDGSRPSFVDLGSIVARNIHRDGDVWHKQPMFRMHFVEPLLLMAVGQERLARWLLRYDINNYDQSTADSAVARSVLAHHAPLPTRLKHLAVTAADKVSNRIERTIGRPYTIEELRRASFERLRREVERASPSAAAHSASASDLQAEDMVERLLAELKPRSILDIRAGNTGGGVVRRAARSGLPVVAFDSDEVLLSALYDDAKRRYPSLRTASIDVMSPRDDLGNYWYEPAHTRLRCELVVGIGVIERWILHDHIRLGAIVDRLATFTDRWLLLDFVPRSSGDLPTWSSDRLSMFSWYSQDAVVAQLQEAFATVSVISETAEGRSWLLCEKSRR